MTAPRIGSLFTGAAGLDMAVEDVFGGTVVWHSENDPAASAVLAHHYPHTPNLGDITQIDWDTVQPVDILCGGFPCQDVSAAAAGRRRGLRDGTRSGLWTEMVNAIDQLRPRFVVVENVRGLLSAKASRVESAGPTVGDRGDGPVLRAAGAVLGSLSDIGYDARWVTLPASAVGAPHKRERVFIVAYPGDDGPHRDTELHTGQFTGVDEENVAYGDDADRCANQVGTHTDGEPATTPVTLLPSPSASDGGGGGHLNRSGARKGELLLPGIARAYETGDLLPTPAAADGTGGGQHPDKRTGHSRQIIDYVLLDETQWGKYRPAIQRWGTLTRPAPRPTEPNTKGNPRLSPAFSEWMMGWPQGWVTQVPGIKRNDQLRIIGNGVAPQQAAAALTHLLTIGKAA